MEDAPTGGGWQGWLERRGFPEAVACTLAFLAYLPAFGFEFVYDDKPQIIQNPAIKAWRYVPSYFTSHAWAELYPNVRGNYYRPLFLLWFRLNHALFRTNAARWHLTAILCHVAVTYLVFALIERLAASRRVAFIGAVLFALHPVHLESVAWVSGVTDPLLAIFLLAALLAYLRSRNGERRWRWMALSLALFTLALLEKETAIVLGPLVFLYAWLYTEPHGWSRRLATALRESAVFFALTLVYLPWRAHVLGGLSHTVTPVSLSRIAFTEPSVIWLYLRHLLVPAGLSGLYGLPYIDSARSMAFWLPATATLLVLGVSWWCIRRLQDFRLAIFAAWFVVLPIVPVLWLRAYAEGDIAHDRYLYIPSIGFVILMALGLEALGRRWRTSRRDLSLAALAAIACAYAIGAITQQTYWASDLRLYGRAYQIAPGDNLIANDLGVAYMDAGDPAKAIALYSQVLEREPGFWLANYNLGYTYYKLGRLGEAETLLRRAISINGADSDQFIYLGLCLWREGRLEEAAGYVAQAIRIRPRAPGYHLALAMIRRDQNNLSAAESEFNLELAYNPGNVAARQQLEGLHAGVAPHLQVR